MTNPAMFDTPPGLSVPGDCNTIQQGIFQSFPGEEVIVSKGTYYENITFMGKDIVLKSTDPLDGDVVSSTTIDGQSLLTCVTFQ